MSRGLPFQIDVPIDFFEKADAPKGQQRRIGGVLSTETKDKQGETILQNGLVFDGFLKEGFFNYDHDKKDIAKVAVGYPTGVMSFEKGATLPNGKKSRAKGHWVEGYLLENYKPADKLWELGKALQGTPRSLSYSVEGAILRREGPKTVLKKANDGSIQRLGERVTKALVKNAAITTCPVNPDASLEILVKSMEEVEDYSLEEFDQRIDALEKALSMGTPETPGTPPEGPVSGEGAGQVLTPESLETGKVYPSLKDDEDEKKKKIKKSLTDSEAIGWLQSVYPSLDCVSAGRIVEFTKARKRKHGS